MGQVNPDESYVFKPTFREGYKPIIMKKIGDKEINMIYRRGNSKVLTQNVEVSEADGFVYVLMMKKCSNLRVCNNYRKSLL